MAGTDDDPNRIDGPYDDIVDADGNVKANVSLDDLLDAAAPPTDAATAAAVKGAARNRAAGDTVDVDLLADVDAHHRETPTVAAAGRAEFAPPVDDGPDLELTDAEAAEAHAVAAQAIAAGADPVDAMLDAFGDTR